MKPYAELTDLGQERRLRRLALDLLDQYAIDVTSCRLAVRSYNTVFKVVTTGGSRYALRVSPAFRGHHDGVERIEAQWMAELCADGIPVPAVIPTVSGDVVSHTNRPDVDGARTAVLFSWVGGHELRGAEATPGILGTFGELIARLHVHPSARRHRPAVMTMDRVLYFRVPDVLDDVPQAVLFREAHDAAQAVVTRIYNRGNDARLLHGDLHLANVMRSRNQLTLLDFQDMAWGQPVQDLAIVTTALRRHTGSTSQDPEAAIAAVRAGYERVRDWPELAPLESLALDAARMLNVFNLSMNVRPQRWDDATYIDKHVDIQRNFLEKIRT